jgi:hypothetical protein
LSDGDGWDVYRPSSIRIGTVVRPVTGDERFDLDMVSRRNARRAKTIQKKLKEEVGVYRLDRPAE